MGCELIFLYQYTTLYLCCWYCYKMEQHTCNPNLSPLPPPNFTVAGLQTTIKEEVWYQLFTLTQQSILNGKGSNLWLKLHSYHVKIKTFYSQWVHECLKIWCCYSGEIIFLHDPDWPTFAWPRLPSFCMS